MTAPSSTPTPMPPPGRSGRAVVIAIVALAVVLAAGAGLWYLFFRPAGPAPVSLASASPVAQASGTAAAPAEASVVASSPSDGASSSPSAAAGTGGGLAGAWAVDPSVGSFNDFSGSFVGYRVREELASIGATEAVGRTPDVTGSITIEGSRLTAATFEADLTTLQSDESRRDGQLRNQALETGTFPTATFTLTTPVDIGSPADGAVVEVTATGDLTLHGVTKTVDIPLQAKLEGGVVTVVGSLPITFADWNMQKPQSMMVLSVEDNGTMEFQLHFTKA